jgi:DNA-binding transcriptional LysR family regulator
MAFLNLRQIEAFRAVMITGSFTKAGNIVHITQPAISRLISDLEYNVGFKLFERLHRRIVPTPEAQLLYIEVDRAFARLHEIEHAAKAIKSKRVGQLNIISMPSLSVGTLSELVREFHSRYPEVPISIEVGMRSEVIDKIATHRFDVGLINADTDNPAVESLPVSLQTAVCIVPEFHVLAQRDLITPIDLTEERFISVQRDAVLRSPLDDVFARAGVVRRNLVEVRTNEAAVGLVSAGLGIAVLMHYGLASDYYRYVKTLPFEPLIQHQMTLIFPAQKVRSQATEAFVRMFYEQQGTRVDSFLPDK